MTPWTYARHFKKWKPSLC